MPLERWINVSDRFWQMFIETEIVNWTYARFLNMNWASNENMISMEVIDFWVSRNSRPISAQSEL